MLILNYYLFIKIYLIYLLHLFNLLNCEIVDTDFILYFNLNPLSSLSLYLFNLNLNLCLSFSLF